MTINLSNNTTLSERLHLRPHTLNMLLLAASAALFIWTIWQHEILVLNNFAPYWWMPYDAGSRFSFGTLYDYSLLLQFVAYTLSPMALWFWSDKHKGAIKLVCLVATILFVGSVVCHELLVFPPFAPSGHVPFDFFWGLRTSRFHAYFITLALEGFAAGAAPVALWTWNDESEEA